MDTTVSGLGLAHKHERAGRRKPCSEKYEMYGRMEKPQIDTTVPGLGLTDKHERAGRRKSCSEKCEVHYRMENP